MVLNQAHTKHKKKATHVKLQNQNNKLNWLITRETYHHIIWTQNPRNKVEEINYYLNIGAIEKQKRMVTFHISIPYRQYISEKTQRSRKIGCERTSDLAIRKWAMVRTRTVHSFEEVMVRMRTIMREQLGIRCRIVMNESKLGIQCWSWWSENLINWIFILIREKILDMIKFNQIRTLNSL
jgi:hypothetical protein